MPSFMFCGPYCAPAPPDDISAVAERARFVWQPQLGIGVKTQPVDVLHESVVQAFASSHTTFVCVTPWIGSHASLVQALLSFGSTAAWRQPMPGLHASVVQALKSLQSIAVWLTPK